MTAIRRLVLDVLKPHDPPILEFTERVASVDSVEGVTTTLVERDEKVQNVKVTLEGEDLDDEAVQAEIDGFGASIHSVDQVTAGGTVVEDRPTPQDR